MYGADRLIIARDVGKGNGSLFSFSRVSGPRCTISVFEVWFSAPMWYNKQTAACCHQTACERWLPAARITADVAIVSYYGLLKDQERRAPGNSQSPVEEVIAMSHKLPIPTVDSRGKLPITVPAVLTPALLLLFLLAAQFPAAAGSGSATQLITAVRCAPHSDDGPDPTLHFMNASASSADPSDWSVAADPDEGTANRIGAPALAEDLEDPVLYLPLMMLGYSPYLIPGQPDLYIHDLVYDECDERVEIYNQGDVAQDLTGWRIQSLVENQWYTFPDGYILAAASSVYVHSGPDAQISPPIHLLWDYDYKWRNAGDKALLYDADSQLVDTFCYGDSCP